MYKGSFPLIALTGIVTLAGLREIFVAGNRVYLLEMWAAAVAVVYFARSSRNGLQLAKTVLPLGLLVIWMSISAVFQLDLQFDSSSFLRYLARVVFSWFLIWLVASLLLMERRIALLRTAAALSSIVLGAFFFQELAIEGVRGRYTGGFVDPNYLSSFLILVVFLLLAGVVDHRLSVARRTVYLGLTSLTLAQALLSFSRAGILSIALGLVLFVVGLAQLMRWRATLTLVLLTVLMVGGLVVVLQAEALPDNLERQWMRWGAQRLTLETSRWLLFRLGIEYIADNPVLGVGAGQSRYVLGSISQELAEGNVAHNTLLEVGLAGGIPLLILFLVTVGRWIALGFLQSLSAVWNGWRYRESSDPLCWLAVACTIASFCLMAMSLDLLTARHSGILVGVCLALPQVATRPLDRYAAVGPPDRIETLPSFPGTGRLAQNMQEES